MKKIQLNKISYKVSVPIIFIFLISFIFITIFVIRSQKEFTKEENIKLAKSTIQNLIANSMDYLIKGNIKEIQKLFLISTENNESIEYIFITNKSGLVIAHTDVLEIGTKKNQNNFDIDALKIKKFSARQIPEDKYKIEICTPILAFGSQQDILGLVRMGINQKAVILKINKIRNSILLIGIIATIIGITVIILVMSFIVNRPIHLLTSSAEKISEGDFNTKVIYQSKDEIGFLGDTFNDMTDKIKDSFEQIKKQEEEYRSLVENLNVGIYRNTGGPHGKFIKANSAIARICGYDSVEDFLSIHVSDLYQNPEERKLYIENIQEKGFVKDLELRFKKKDGTPMLASVNTKVKYDENGNIQWMDGILEDITERKRIEEEVKGHRDHLKELVEERTMELKEKNKEIMESIYYVKNIQFSSLPKRNLMDQSLKNYFIIWKPQNIVGGDYYWFNQIGEDFMLSIMDCTGHGVSGALLTMTVNNILHRITEDICNNNPAKILANLNIILRSTLHQDVKETPSNDGADIGICYYKKNENKLIYAGSVLPLLYVRNNKILIVNGDKQSVGYKQSDIHYQYKNHVIQLDGNETFYLFSDGYMDQTGGEKGYVFGKKRFYQLLYKIKNKPLKEQRKILESNLKHYLGDKFSQVDDVTVLAFQI